MSMFGDYKAYKTYEPAYASWKNRRDIKEAKRLEYLKRHPNEISKEDIQRGQTIIRAIDIMDEYSQKRAEDMEVATQSAMGLALEFLTLTGAGLGFFLGNLKPVKQFLSKILKNQTNKKTPAFILSIIPTIFGGILGTVASFPLQAWAAKAEVSASRKGRFEAMRKELNNPNGFAILTEEQIEEAKEKSKQIQLEEDKSKNQLKSKLKDILGIESLKALAGESKEYKQQKRAFEAELLETQSHLNDKMSEKEIENAKKDQQLLTKLVEKIDIASQDYAENAELAADTATSVVLGASFLVDFAITKLMSACKVKSADKISAATKIAGLLLSLGTAIIGAQVSKQASRVGRFKVKQELIKNPENFVYVDDEKIANIKDFELTQKKKEGIFSFLKNAYKNNKEFEKYKKTTAKDEKRFYKAVETLKLSDEQLKDAKVLQRNAFRTFNKVDENSQKYSENIEALGQAIMYPISLISSGIGMAIGLPIIARKTKNSVQQVQNFAKYMGIVLLSTVPTILINAYNTKEQKKASRVADMLAINEMQDYRTFK